MQANTPPPLPRALDVYARVSFFVQLPDYQNYLAGYHKLPPVGDGGRGLLWNFATPSGPFYDQALPSYMAQVLQSQTPLAGGGTRRAGPAGGSEAAAGAPATRPRQSLPEVLDPAVNPEAAAQSLGPRLLGDARRRAALTVWEPRPEENQDRLHWERLAVYFVLARDNSLRYNVDSGRFVRVYSDGECRDVLSMAWVGQVLRQGQADRWNRVEQRLSRLPLDQHLFTPPPPPPPRPLPRTRKATPPAAAAPAAPAGGGAAPKAGTAPQGGAAGPAGRVAPKVGAGPAGPVGPVVPVGAGAVEVGAAEVVPAAAPVVAVPTTRWSLKVHRYWDLSAGSYSDVVGVRLEGDDGDESVENSEGKPWIALSRELPLGSRWRITIRWANGMTRGWEQEMSDPRGSDSEVFSPEG